MEPLALYSVATYYKTPSGGLSLYLDVFRALNPDMARWRALRALERLPRRRVAEVGDQFVSLIPE